MNKWIPVSERLPENEDDILICDITGDMSTGWYYPETNSWTVHSKLVEDVVAWRPLPEPYKED